MLQCKVLGELDGAKGRKEWNNQSYGRAYDDGADTRIEVMYCFDIVMSNCFFSFFCNALLFNCFRFLVQKVYKTL